MATPRDKWDGPERRILDDGWMAGLPVWVKAAFVLGPTTLISLFLVYIGATYAPQILSEVKAMHVEQSQVRQQNEDLKKQNEQLYRLMQMFCVNAAKTEADKTNCFRN